MDFLLRASDDEGWLVGGGSVGWVLVVVVVTAAAAGASGSPVAKSIWRESWGRMADARC